MWEKKYLTNEVSATKVTFSILQTNSIISTFVYEKEANDQSIIEERNGKKIEWRKNMGSFPNVLSDMDQIVYNSLIDKNGVMEEVELFEEGVILHPELLEKDFEVIESPGLGFEFLEEFEDTYFDFWLGVRFYTRFLQIWRPENLPA